MHYVNHWRSSCNIYLLQKTFFFAISYHWRSFGRIYQRKKNERKGFAEERGVRRIAKRAQANATERKQTFSAVGFRYQCTHYFLGPTGVPKKERGQRPLFLYLILWHYLLSGENLPEPLINKGVYALFRQKNVYIDI